MDDIDFGAATGPSPEDMGGQTPPKRISTQEEAQRLSPGSSFIGPDEKEHVVPFHVEHPEQLQHVPDGADFIGPDGKLRQKPRYQGVDYTAQTLYDMGVNDKERKKALERSYPGKVRDDPSGGFFVEDDDGVLRKPGRGIQKYTGGVSAAAAPTILSVLGALGGGAAGTVGGGAAGSAVPVAGTIAGGMAGGTAGTAAGGAGGAVLGQQFNDLILTLAGTIDRTPTERFVASGEAALGGMAGAGVGRGVAMAVPSLKTGASALSSAAPSMMRSWWGAGEADLKMARGLAEQGVSVPPSAWAKEAPHLQNVVEVFDPAFHTQKPLLESATAHYEKNAGALLAQLGVKDPGTLTKPIADVPTREAGEALLRKTLGEVADADAKMKAALEQRKAQAERLASLPAGTAPHGGGSGYEGYKTPIHDPSGKEVGSIEYTVEPDHVEVRYPFIEDEARGKGLGVSTYEHLADWALSRGKELRSGTDVSPMAMRVYEGLERRGYKVVWPSDKASATTHTGAYAGREGIRVTDGPAGKVILSQREALQQAAEQSRAAAQNLIDAGYKDIESDISTAMKVAKAGHNSGDLWGAVGQKLVALRRGVGARATQMYNEADQAAGGHLPNIEGLPDTAEQFLNQLPPDFQNRYPDMVRKLRDLAGVKNEKGEWVKEPVNPTFGQLHDIRSQFRQNVNYYDLAPDVREGTYKFFAGKVDQVLHDKHAVPELQEASKLLDAADKFYSDNIKIFNSQQVKAVMRGLEAGEPADPQNLYNVIVRSGQSNLTNKIKEMVGPNLWAGVKAADTQAMLDGSKTLTPGEIDGKKFAREVLDRVRDGTLELVHGKEAEKLREQALRIEQLAGREPIPVRPGDTPTQVIARARQAQEVAKATAKADPLTTLNREMKKVQVDHAKEVARMKAERRNDPLGFLYDPTTGATEAVNRILDKEDLTLAAAIRFGEKSPEFEQMRQLWAQRFLTGTMKPSERLKDVSPEIQAVMFPGVSLNQMQTLSKEMDFLLNTRANAKGDFAGGMSAMSKVEHPASRAVLAAGGFYLGGPVGAAAGLATPIAARAALGLYYKTIRQFMTSPALMRWLEKGLNGSPADREAVRRSIQGVLQKGGAVGAGLGEAVTQSAGPQ